MKGILTRMGWFTAVAVAMSYMTYFVAGNFVSANAAAINDPVIARDVIGPNTHRLSGIIFVPSPCDQLSVGTFKSSANTFELVFKTWHEPSVTCKDDLTPRSFDVLLYAPAAGVYFAATLDSRPLPFDVTPVLPDPN